MSQEDSSNHTKIIPAYDMPVRPQSDKTVVLSDVVGCANPPPAKTQEVAKVTSPAVTDAAPSEPFPLTDFKSINLPGFEFCSCLGIGGMGAVYLAKQKSLGRYVAVKMIKSEYAHLPRYHDRIVAEAQTMAALNHPNVISCYDIITTPDHVFVIMEYIPGGMNVKNLITRFGRLDDTIVIRILTDVVEGLSYIHQKGFIHQDLKPDNLMIYCSSSSPSNTPAEIFAYPGNRIVISDFGIARNVKKTEKEQQQNSNASTQTVVGSPLYMPPEQYFTPDNIDLRADIYALASTAYHLLTGELPFNIQNAEELMHYKQNHGIPDPRALHSGQTSKDKSTEHKFNDELCEIIMRMGKPNPDDRYRSYDILLQDLHHVQTLNTIWFRVAGREAKSRAFRHGIILSGCIALLVILPFVVKNYIWNRYFSPLKVSLAQSTAFWEKDGAQAWHRMPPDLEEPHVYLRGMNTTEPLVLKQHLTSGHTIEFKARFFGIAQVGFGLRNESGNLLNILWKREDNGKVVFMIAPYHKPFTYIGEFNGKHPNKWVHFQIQIDKTQAVVLMDNKVLGVGHFHKPLAQCQFFVSLSRSRYMELKDIYVNDLDSSGTTP